MSPQDALQWLYGREMLDGSPADRGNVIKQFIGRNRGFLIRTPGGTEYFLKVPSGSGRAPAIVREAGIYEALSGMPGINAVIPEFVTFDLRVPLLALKGVTGGRSMDPLVTPSGRDLARHARHLARALSRLHRMSVPDAMPKAPRPSAHDLALPTSEMLYLMSPANMQLVRLLQKDERLMHVFESVRTSWAATSFTHGDLKWGNCLVFDGPPASRRSVRILDLESSGRGDPTWDVGCILASYLHSWLRSVDSAVAMTGSTRRPQIELTLPDIQLAVRAFWQTYEGAGLSSSERKSSFLLQSMHQATCRLAWFIFEDALNRDTLGDGALMVLQVAHNMASRPLEGLRELLGLEA